MHRTELEDFIMEALGEEMPNLSIEVTDDGQLVIFTGMAEDPEGEVIDFEDFDKDFVEESEEEVLTDE